MRPVQILAHHPKVSEWVARNLPPSEGIRTAEDFGPHTAIGFVRDGCVVAGVVYNWFIEMPHGNDVRITICAKSPLWATRDVVRAIAEYPFKVAGCARVTAVVREGNNRSMRALRAAGFRKEGVLRRAYNGKANAIVFGMLKHECKWLEDGSHGR